MIKKFKKLWKEDKIIVILSIVLLLLLISLGVYLTIRDSDSVSDDNVTIECVWVYQPALKMSICQPYTFPKK